MSEISIQSENHEVVVPYWTWRRSIAFFLIQLSWAVYLLGAGAFGAFFIIGKFWGKPAAKATIVQAVPLISVLYLIHGLMILAVLLALLALLFSRRALYLAIPYVPTGIYAYYNLTT
jgi:fatty acid desaturase